jgi:hypothetical protein
VAPKPPLPKDITDPLRNVAKGSLPTSMAVAATTLTLVELEHIEICLSKPPASVDWLTTVLPAVLSAVFFGGKILIEKRGRPEGWDLVAVVVAFGVLFGILMVNVKKSRSKDLHHAKALQNVQTYIAVHTKLSGNP